MCNPGETPLKWFILAAAMPTQNIHHKNIFWRDHSGSTRLQFKKKTVKRRSLLQRANFSNQHVQDIVWAWDNKLLWYSASWDCWGYPQIWGDYSPPNYDARQGICDCICILWARICSIGSSGRWYRCEFCNKRLARHDGSIAGSWHQPASREIRVERMGHQNEELCPLNSTEQSSHLPRTCYSLFELSKQNTRTSLLTSTAIMGTKSIANNKPLEIIMIIPRTIRHHSCKHCIFLLYHALNPKL